VWHELAPIFPKGHSLAINSWQLHFHWRGGQPSRVAEQVPSDVIRVPVRLSSWRVLPRLSVSHYVHGEVLIPPLSNFKKGKFCVWVLFALTINLRRSVLLEMLIVVEMASKFSTFMVPECSTLC
jgi:hypothetical protein